MICRPDNGQAAQKNENVLICLAEKFLGVEMLYEELEVCFLLRIRFEWQAMDKISMNLQGDDDNHFGWGGVRLIGVTVRTNQ